MADPIEITLKDAIICGGILASYFSLKYVKKSIQSKTVLDYYTGKDSIFSRLFHKHYLQNFNDSRERYQIALGENRAEYLNKSLELIALEQKEKIEKIISSSSDQLQ